MLRADALPVLVVDDDAALLRTLKDILSLQGFASQTASSAERALTLAQTMTPPPAVAVVDLRLPDMDGLDLVARLRGRVPHLQVVILTGNASVDSAIRAVRDQGCDYLVKPVQPEDLVDALGTAEGRWRLGRTTEALEQTQALLGTVFRESPLGLVVMDDRLLVRLWNPAAERIFGWEAGEVIGRRPPFADADERHTLAAIESALRGDSSTGLELQVRGRDGAPVDLRLSVASLGGLSSAGGALLVCEDMTERRQLEAHLQHAQRLDAVGRLAGGIAHDFNNLLAVIRTEADLARSGSAPDPEVAQALESIMTTADRGATLTRQLLTFARRQPMESAVVDPNVVVADLKRMLDRLVGGRIPLQTDLQPGVGGVKVDRGQLEQVLTNLVVNARDATPTGGAITIETRRETVEVPGARHGLDVGEWVVLTVRDTGKGIPEELHTMIFEPFFTTKERGAGTGLGLSTSYGIVRRLGGLIALESEVGRGSAFHVCLPRASAQHPVEGEAAGAASPAGSETILIVEDHVELRSATRRILERQGYSVHVATDMDEAWRTVAESKRPPDLLMVDAHLPDGDGRDFIRTFRARFPGVRALLTSGSFELAERGDVDVPFLEKPYTLDSLARAVRAAIDGRPDPSRP